MTPGVLLWIGILGCWWRVLSIMRSPWFKEYAALRQAGFEHEAAVAQMKRRRRLKDD